MRHLRYTEGGTQQWPLLPSSVASHSACCVLRMTFLVPWVLWKWSGCVHKRLTLGQREVPKGPSIVNEVRRVYKWQQLADNRLGRIILFSSVISAPHPKLYSFNFLCYFFAKVTDLCKVQVETSRVCAFPVLLIQPLAFTGRQQSDTLWRRSHIFSLSHLFMHKLLQLLLRNCHGVLACPLYFK